MTWLMALPQLLASYSLMLIISIQDNIRIRKNIKRVREIMVAAYFQKVSVGVMGRCRLWALR